MSLRNRHFRVVIVCKGEPARFFVVNDLLILFTAVELGETRIFLLSKTLFTILFIRVHCLLHILFEQIGHLGVVPQLLLRMVGSLVALPQYFEFLVAHSALVKRILELDHPLGVILVTFLESLELLIICMVIQKLIESPFLSLIHLKFLRLEN